VVVKEQPLQLPVVLVVLMLVLAAVMVGQVVHKVLVVGKMPAVAEPVVTRAMVGQVVIGTPVGRIQFRGQVAVAADLLILYPEIPPVAVEVAV
jgi:hypothetical protein